MNRNLFPRWSAWLALLLAFATGCTTIQYRGVQGDFEKAVRAELEGAELPYVDWYQSVAIELTPAYIEKLNPVLQPNAWLLRSLSQWRSDEFAAARESATEGLDAVSSLEAKDKRWAGSRDKILLTMAPGLVKDSELRVRFLKDGTNDLNRHFADVYQPEMVAALNQFKAALASINEGTAESVRVYWSFQTWRLLQNWATYCIRLPQDNREAALANADRSIQNNFSEMLGGATTLKGGRDYLRNELGTNHLYFRIIEAPSSANKILGP